MEPSDIIQTKGVNLPLKKNRFHFQFLHDMDRLSESMRKTLSRKENIQSIDTRLIKQGYVVPYLLEGELSTASGCAFRNTFIMKVFCTK